MTIFNNSFDNLLLPLALLLFFLLSIWAFNLFRFLKFPGILMSFMKYYLICIPAGFTLGVFHFLNVWSIRTPTIFIDGEQIIHGREYEGLQMLQKAISYPGNPIRYYFFTDVIAGITICLMISTAVILFRSWKQEQAKSAIEIPPDDSKKNVKERLLQLSEENRSETISDKEKYAYEITSNEPRDQKNYFIRERETDRKLIDTLKKDWEITFNKVHDVEKKTDSLSAFEHSIVMFNKEMQALEDQIEKERLNFSDSVALLTQENKRLNEELTLMEASLKAQSEQLSDRTDLVKELKVLRNKIFDLEKQLEKYKMEKVISEQRSCKRMMLAVPVFYTYSYKKDDLTGSCSDHGTSFDYSDSGISFYSHRLFVEGDEVTIVSNDLWDKHRAGTVKWCKPLNYNFYLVGMSLKKIEAHSVN
jgi:hypothetical protein